MRGRPKARRGLAALAVVASLLAGAPALAVADPAGELAPADAQIEEVVNPNDVPGEVESGGGDVQEPETTQHVAQVGGATYATLDNAISAAEDGATIELLGDATLENTLDKTMTIDGNGHTITSIDKSFGFTAGRKLVFNDVTLSFEYTKEVENPTFDSDLGLFYINGGKGADGKPLTDDAVDFTFNNSSVSFTNTGATNRLHAIYYDSCGGTITLNNSTLTIKDFPEDAIEWGGQSNSYINILNGSTYTSNHNRGGIIGTWNVKIDSSTVNVLDSTTSGSNGANYDISASKVTYSGSVNHGISATDFEVRNSSEVSAYENGYYGIYVNGKFLVDKTSRLDVKGNSDAHDCAGLKLTANVEDGRVENGAVVTITDNYCSGLSNNGKVAFEEGAKLTITGNTNDKGGESGSHGGGVYNSGSGAELTLPSDAVIYDNHALTDGDDIFNNTAAKITFGKVGANWSLDGVGIDGAVHCKDVIDGWYDDSADARWEAHSAPYHIEEFTPGDETHDGLLALKAAHGIIPIDPEDPTAPQWTKSKSKTATRLDSDNISEVTLSLPAEDYTKSMDVVFVIDDTHAGSGIFEEAVNELLDELAGKDKLDVNVGVVAFDAVSRDWLKVTSGGAKSGLVSIGEGDNLDAVKKAVGTELAYDGEGQKKKIGGTNTEWPVDMAAEMLESGDGEDKYLIMFSDLYGYVYRGEIELDGETYSDVPLSKRCSNRDLGELTISAPMFKSWQEVYAGRTSDKADWDSFFRSNNYNSAWTNYWKYYQGLDVTGADQEDAPHTNHGEAYFTPFEKSACLTYDNILKAAGSGIQVVLVNNNFDPDHGSGANGLAIQAIKNGMLDDLADQGFTVIREDAEDGVFSSEQMGNIFETLENELVQLVDAGSYVVDEMGSGECDGVEYDFDFVDDAGSLRLAVGGEELEVKAADKGDADAAYKFGTEDDDDMFVLKYYKDGTTVESDYYGAKTYGECFVWEINVPVMKDATVQLTYSVKLDYPQSSEGVHGTYDADGDEKHDALRTNNVATLFPVDSEGNPGAPQNFLRPTVEYAVGKAVISPVDITIYMNGEDGYEGVVVAGEQTGSKELPEPGFYVTLPGFVNEMLAENGLAEDGRPANLSGLLTVTASAADGKDRTWTLEPYGVDPDTSSASGGYIYRVVPAEGQDPVRLEFTDGGGNTQVSDTFDPGDALYSTYTMGVYSGGVETETLEISLSSEEHGIDLSLPLETGKGVLTIRYVTSESQEDTVSEVLEAEGGQATDDELRRMRQANPTKGFAVLDADATYYVNGSTVEVAPGDEYHDAKPSLLFDDVVSGDGGEYEGRLVGKAAQAVLEAGVSLGDEYEHESKYLDLVDANNGNAWLTTDSAVTVYWPYPGETTKDTDFYLVHVHDLDRDMSSGEVLDQISQAEAEYIAIDDASKTDHGIRFTLEPGADDRVSFSPFVLMWTAATEPDPVPGPQPTTGSLKVTKAITGDLSSPDDVFAFTVTLSGTSAATGDKTYGGVKFTDGVATITLRGGQSKTLTNIPGGTKYTVEETDAKGYELASFSGTTGMISAGTTRTASFTNDKSAADAPEPATARFVARKVLNGAELKAGQFTFELRDADGKVVATATNDASGTIVFDGLTFDEAGTYEFTISEVNGGSEDYTYDASVKGCYVVVSEEDGKLVAEAFAHDDLVFTNEYVGTEDPGEPDEPDTPDTPDTPDEPGEPTTPVTPGEDVPDTGDHTDGALPAALALGGVALVGGALVLKVRRDH